MFLFMNQITQILLFLGIPVLQRSKITVWERHLFKKKFCNGTFGFVSALSKNIFSGAQVKYFCLSGPNNPDFTMKKKKRERILLFSWMPFLERSKITVWEQHFFKKNLCYGSFGFVSTLRKNAFLGPPVKCVFLYGSNNSDSFASGNADFTEIKDHTLSTIDF